MRHQFQNLQRIQSPRLRRVRRGRLLFVDSGTVSSLGVRIFGRTSSAGLLDSVPEGAATRRRPFARLGDGGMGQKRWIWRCGEVGQPRSGHCHLELSLTVKDFRGIIMLSILGPPGATCLELV